MLEKIKKSKKAEKNEVEKNEVEKEETLTTHLIELRQRIIYISMGIIVIFLILLPFRNELYTQFAQPAIQNLNEGVSLVAFKAIDAFLIPLKLCLFIGVLVTLPWILYQIWGFVAPGLYKHERKLIAPLVASTTFLFYLGILFAYFVVIPLVFGFLVTAAPEGSQVMPGISEYFSFVFTIFIAFGIAFEVPVATVLLVLIGVTDVASLKAKRRYVIVAAFVFGMILTPPDMISQTLLAIPMWVLFKIGLLVAEKKEKKSDKDREDEIKEITAND